MKTRLIDLAAVAAVALLPQTLEPLHAADRAAQWKAVEEAINKGLPRTAITNLEPIIAGAIQDKAWGEAAKAIARKIVLEANIQGNKPEEKIKGMDAAIAQAPREVLPVLQTLRAHWYWHYFQQNRWRFMRRTATAEAPGQDFTTWDLPRLFAEIDKHFQAALSHSELLKKTPVSAFDDLLEKGSLPDSYRPTLYDFIAHEALGFYTSGEQAAAKPQDAFEVPADSPMLGAVEEFLAWKPQTTDTNCQILKAIELYQDLLRFHQNDADPTAFLDVDLARLVYGHNVAFGEIKDTRYKAALKAFVDKWADHELSALALYHWARQLQAEGELVEAHRLAQRGQNAHPKSVGARMCHNLIAEIESKSASITTERVWNWPTRTKAPSAAVQPPAAAPADRPAAMGQADDVGPKITVRYRNVTNVWFRAVAWAWEDFLSKNRSRPEYLNDAERKELLRRKPALEWSAQLPPTPDFKERTVHLAAPDTLTPGHYFIVASHDPGFGENENQVSYTPVWVSDLALVVRTREGAIEGFVLEAGSGEPVAGAEITAWFLDREGNRVPEPKQTTDENGFFSFKPRQQRGYLIRARHKDQELATENEVWSHERGRAGPHEQTVLFTDRALYRPGQTVSYKGILLRVDAEQNNYELLKGRRLTVYFRDPNGKEVARAEHVCNDYGSFAGSFTAPRDRVTGQYRIEAINGAAWFNVEEYKRPKFQVTLEAPKTAPKLNAKVVVPGKAEAYTGAAIDDALVRWRVVREVRWPDWWAWWSWRWPGPRAGESQEIAHGTTRTGADGTFQIEFVARPDPKVSETNEASFTFTVYADVTDSAGETRSDQRRVNVGFVALRASLTAEEWQTDDNPVELKIRTTTLDGEPQVAEGTVKIYELQAPARVHRRPLPGPTYFPDPSDPSDRSDPSDPRTWPLGKVVAERGFTTDAEGRASLQVQLGAGAWRAVLETQDRFGKRVTAQCPLQVLRPADPKLGLKIPHLLAAPKWSIEPGEEFVAVWGTGYDSGRAFVEIEHRRQMLQRFWTRPGQTQQQIRQAVTEAMRGGFHLHITQVRENRAYLVSRKVEVPWTNKELKLTWEHFVSNLQPGQKETWSLVIQGPKQKADGASPERLAAELVAALYDASLDQFKPHGWLERFGFFYQDWSGLSASFANNLQTFRHILGHWPSKYVPVELRYRKFPDDLVANFWGYEWGFGRTRMMMARGVTLAEAAALPPPAGAPAAEMALGVNAAKAAAVEEPAAGVGGRAQRRAVADRAEAGEPPAPPKPPDLGQVTARRNLNETAFFFPQLTSDSNGVVRLTFTMPEALTTWRFLAFAHDQALRSGYLEDKAVTAKDIMVQPNPPRFLREGDVLEFTVKVSNQSAARQQGRVRLTFSYAFDEKPADGDLGNKTTELPFDIPAKESRSFAWRITVPDGCGFLTYKAVASTGRLSDGEEGYLAVLSRRIFVTESLPLPIRGKVGGGEVIKKFRFDKLLQSGQSPTLQHQSFTVQMVSQPAWYAVMALPYLMECPYECTEQTFNRLYANALARHIANSDPKIRRVFDQWKGTPALDSPLEKNQDLKAVMLEETPWLRQAQNESQARKNVGLLFDDNRLANELDRALAKLREAQLGDGRWPWFPGGPGNDYITLYIVTGFGRLRHLGVDVDVSLAVRALQRLDIWMDEHYRRILTRSDPDKYVPGPTDALYLYGRSFFLKDRPVGRNQQEAVNFFLKQARKHWLQTASRQTQGHLALALKRFNAVPAFAVANDPTPMDILRSLKERSVTHEELGMFWRDTELSWWWYRAPIETQALMIEAFDEVAGDREAVEELRVWLLKQKQTQDWKTTKATADAVYALLLRGRDLLASDKLVEVTVGGKLVTPSTAPAPGAPARPAGDRTEVRAPDRPVPAIEPGTGFYEVRFIGPEVKPALGEITVRKVDEGVSWGSVHWQYLENMTKVTPYEGTPLKLTKSLYTRVNTPRGPELRPVKGPLAVGDELVVRIELRVDRDMEYVHLKDQRGSGTEPVNVLSRYKYQDGLAYYESTRDTASHFFIDYLPKGTYVFEYATRVQHRGTYQTGMASIQCMYAPEFNSHSQSFTLTVQ
jgi:hypothetical protein